MPPLKEKQIHNEQVRVIFENADFLGFANIAAIAILTTLFWEKQPVPLLLPWGLVMLLLAFASILILQQRKAKDPDFSAPDLWLKRYISCAYALSFGWGSTAFFLFDETSTSNQIVLILILLGACASSIPVIAPLRRTFFAYILLLGGPLTLRLLTSKDSTLFWIGVLAVIFLVQVLFTSFKMYHSLRKTLKLRIENQFLITKISQEKFQSDQINLELKSEIIQRKSIESELQKAKDIVDEQHRAKSNFLGNMSHELRTPLNSILGMTQLTLDTQLTPEQNNNLRAVLQSSESLLSLLNGIFELSLMEFGEARLKELEFDLLQLFEDTLEDQAQQAHSKELELEGKLPYLASPLFLGDPIRLRTILNHLLENAVKFTETGEIFLSLEVVDEANHYQELKVTIQDTGIGISEEIQEKIFRSFTQGDSSKTRKYGGAGLGLSLAQQIIHLMGGELSVQSKLGQGSTFSFTIKLKKSTAAVNAKSQQVLTLRQEKILIVDQVGSFTRVASTILKQAGHHVTKADQAEADVTWCQQVDDHSLALVNLPVNSIEAESWLQKIQAYSLTIPILYYCTSEQQRTFANRNLNLSSKPIKSKEILEKIQTPLNSPETKPIQPQVDRKHLRILLADDSLINRALVMVLLKKQGYLIDEVENGLKALQAQRQQPYDLIFMDVQMPEMNGFEATQKIRMMEQQQGGHVIIVAMTASNMEGDRERCLANGMDEYLCKPIDSTKLFGLLNQLFSSPTKNPNSQIVDSLQETAGRDEALLDLEAGIKRWGGQKDLFLKILEDFTRDHQGDGQKIQNALKNQDFKMILELSHALRGVASNLSTEALLKAAQELELATQQDHREALPGLVLKVDELLQKTCEAITALSTRQAMKPLAPTKVQVQQPIDLEAMDRNLHQLFQCLRRGEAVTAASQIASIRQPLLNTGLGTNLEVLLEQIDNFDFLKAEHTLGTIQEVLGLREEKGL